MNNKGYMLVEIILAFTLAIGVGYFLIELTLKAKNTNDDLVVASLVRTDQGIIYNTIMKDIYNNPEQNLDEIESKISIDGDKLTYDDKVIVLNQYASFGEVVKDNSNNKITIPLEVKQMPDENFNIEIYLIGEWLEDYKLVVS